MKKKILLSLCLLNLSIGYSQFGMDVIINNQPAIDQRNTVLATAFNGWLYSAYTTVDSASNQGGITIRKSIDKGVTWTTIDAYSVGGIRYEDVEIVAAGTDTNNLFVFVAGINHDIIANTYTAYIDRYNGLSGTYLFSPFNKTTGIRKIYDLSLASDYEFPGVSASPFSLGLLMSEYTSSMDSINFYASVDGGNTFTVQAPVATTGGYFNRVSLSYGRSASGSNGRYFGAWEQHTSGTARNGHIYTSRSTSQVNSTTWIPPICLDSLSSTMINLCRNPRISTQYNNTDNDSSSLTSVILVDRDYNGDATDYDLLGFFNKRAHYTNFWYRLDVVNTGENDIQPDITFDPVGNNFHATYLDSTNQKLLYISNGVNLLTPNVWAVADSQYNDTSVLTNAYPRLSYNQAEAGIGAVWTTKGTGTKGVSLFDANYTVLFVGINEEKQPVLDIQAYPNPVTDVLIIDLTNIESARLSLYNLSGQLLEVFNVVSDNQQLSMSQYSPGTYILQFEHNGQTVSKKIIKQ